MTEQLSSIVHRWGYVSVCDDGIHLNFQTSGMLPSGLRPLPHPPTLFFYLMLGIGVWCGLEWLSEHQSLEVVLQLTNPM